MTTLISYISPRYNQTHTMQRNATLLGNASRASGKKKTSKKKATRWGRGDEDGDDDDEPWGHEGYEVSFLLSFLLSYDDGRGTNGERRGPSEIRERWRAGGGGI